MQFFAVILVIAIVMSVFGDLAMGILGLLIIGVPLFVLVKIIIKIKAYIDNNHESAIERGNTNISSPINRNVGSEYSYRSREDALSKPITGITILKEIHVLVFIKISTSP